MIDLDKIDYSSLREISSRFEDICSKMGCEIDLVSDEPELQGFVLKDKSQADNIRDQILPDVEKYNIHMEMDNTIKDGASFVFAIKPISDGHWKLLPKNRKREDFSSFVNPEDARRVRSGQTMYQKNKRLLDDIDLRIEDQYKSPTGKHRRDQSMFRSSFRKSRSFGGLSEGAAVVGSSIPIKKEPDTNIALRSANRSNSSGENKKMRPYSSRTGEDRSNAFDNPILPPFSRDRKNAVPRIGVGKKSVQERTIPGTRLGRTNDDSLRSISTKKLVPNSDAGEEALDGPEDIIGGDIDSRIDGRLNVVPDSVPDKERADPYKALARRQNMRPLGEFGLVDLRQPSGGPVSNVMVQHPRDRSFDNTAPTVIKRKVPKL